MYIPSGKDEPLQPSYTFNHEQGREIILGLQPGHRLAYDKTAQRFVALAQKSSDEKYVQDLDTLADKINEFIEKARGKGLSDQDVWNIEKAALSRSHELQQRASGIRGLFMSRETQSYVSEKAASLERIASLVDNWAVNYLDEYRLIGSASDQPIESRHREWYLNQGIYLKYMERTDEITRRQLGLAMLHGYSKAAAIREEDSRSQGIQTTPVLPEDLRYHRSTSNQLLTSVNDAYASEMNIKPQDLHLVSSPLLREVFAREMPIPGVDLDIGNVSEFEKMMDQLFEQAARGIFPEKLVMFDITRLLTNLSYRTEDIYEVTNDLEKIAWSKFQDYRKAHPLMQAFQVKRLMSRLQPFAFAVHQGQHALLTPTMVERSFAVRPFINGILQRTGFYLSPDQAKAAWLAIDSPQAILETLGLPRTSLATRGRTVPEVCRDFTTFLEQPVVQKFEALSSSPEAPPYLKILPHATVELLRGLAEHDIDRVFRNKGIGDVLQISYFRMINAMNEAILRRDDLTAFNNQIELLHQEIQTILAMVEPYPNGEFAKSVMTNLTTGEKPLIASDLPQPQVHLKHSATHSISSTLASVEAQKGNNKLNVAILKDSYYESGHLLEQSRSYQLTSFDGDQGRFDTPPVAPLDVFLCEFHHNISVTRQDYRPERIKDFVKEMVAQKRVADQFTVIIDTTINLEHAEEIRAFLEDPVIKQLILEGKLNVVLVRSAQKFDMLGIDNYYGGISISINEPGSFAQFNARMGHPDDQLRGLSYQGLTHLETYASASIEAYRSALMESTQALYGLLPPAAIYHAGTTNPMQISRIEDERLVFLDVKFPSYPQTAQVFGHTMARYIQKHRLPLSARPSFGFATTNFVVIYKEDQPLIRLTPGLESAQTLQLYAQFVVSVQKVIEQTLRETQGQSTTAIDALIAERLASMNV